MIQKFLFRPLNTWSINQGFGENKACYDPLTNKVVSKVPFTDEASCPAGYKSVYSNMKGHNGLDVDAYRWQEVYASHSGIVTEVQTEVARGLGVGITTDKKWYCQETGKPELFKSRYWHFIALDVYMGEKITVGDLIGYADSTGYSSGDHLHFELKVVDEFGENRLQGNGYFGAVDPTPYMEPIFAVEFAGLYRQVKELIAKMAGIIADRLRK